MQLRLKLTKKWSIGTPEKHQFVLRYIPVLASRMAKNIG